jgi:hypothetical protein
LLMKLWIMKREARNYSRNKTEHMNFYVLGILVSL